MYSTKQILPINLYGIAQIASNNESYVENFFDTIDEVVIGPTSAYL